jgi:ABC-2 type transport system permease protein
MNNNTVSASSNVRRKMTGFIRSFRLPEKSAPDTRTYNPFMIIVRKEISDHVRSWRFIIMLALISLTCLGSVYTGLAGLSDAVNSDDPENPFFFLKLFTISDGTLPPFFVFISFLGPLLGIAMGFDAVNSEEIKGTISRILAQPVPRDYLLNAKFVAALTVISIMFFALGFLVIGLGLIVTGIPPLPEEFIRVIIFLIISIVYVSFWLNLSIYFSVKFRQPATSALTGIAVWLFLTVFYGIFVSLVAKAAAPSAMASEQQYLVYQEFILGLLRVLPSQLFSDATTTMLVPSIRSLGPMTMEQIYGTIPGPLPLGQSLLLVWPQITGLLAATMICFVLSYTSFMKREIRSR